ncbi:MAG: hypothetical protein WCO57_14015 [Verrucomicrobiota bacterium]
MSKLELQELVADLARSTKELRTSQQETDRQMKETALQMKETDQKIKALSGLFTSQWGKLVEALMRPGTVKLFQARGVVVSQMTGRRTGVDHADREIEVDMTLVNSGTIVVVEVKTSCKVEDVVWHLDKLQRFKQAFSEYATWDVQGGLAALTFEEESDRYAFRNGLWVLKCQDGITSIANSENFQAQVF